MIILTIILLGIVALLVYWRFFYFFRDPDRTIPSGNNIVAPADGKIVYVRKIKDGVVPISIKKGKEIKLEEITKIKNLELCEKYIIGIFMFAWSVHVNRSPISGVTKFKKYFKGKNVPMIRMLIRSFFGLKPYYKNSNHILQNERNTILIEGKFPVMIVQIADFYVRKILCYVKLNQKLQKGQRIGMIRMGSQVDCVFPNMKGLEIKVKDGQKVKAGETILATY